MKRLKSIVLTSLLAAAAAPAPGSAQEMTPDLVAFVTLYKELVEINTTLSVGDCTRAAEAMATRLRTGGFADSDLHIIVPPEFPRQGNLVAIFPGSDPEAGAILLVGHLDVVEADAKDWERDPFTLVEEDGFFWARGSADDKAMVSILLDSLIRYKQEGFVPRRTLKLALTCGEETSAVFNGMKYLIDNHRDLIDAQFGINENGNGRLDENERRIMMTIQAGQKIAQNFILEITGPGGRSSRPMGENIIYDLAHALTRLEQYEFPVDIDNSVRRYFERATEAEARMGVNQLAEDLLAVLKTPPDADALARISSNRMYGPIIRTTCTATLLEGGHAWNALAQRAAATINCRIKPGMSIAHVQQTLEEVVANDRIRVIPTGDMVGGTTTAPPLTPEIMGPIEEIAARLWPGVPVVPALVPGSDDSRYLTPAGIPTYGISGQYRGWVGDGTHALNERIRVQVLYDAREFLYSLIKIYASN